MAAQAPPGEGLEGRALWAACTGPEDNPQEMAQGLTTSHKPTDRLGGRLT